LLVLAGCGGKARPITYANLAPKLGGLEFTHITVDLSRTREDLLVVLARNNPGRRIDLPPVDYTRQETFVVAAGPRSSTGYSLRVVRAQEQGDHIEVVVRERTPSLGDPVRPRVTYPFLVLAFPSHKPVHLKWLGRP
jgi:hypothetical protein